MKALITLFMVTISLSFAFAQVKRDETKSTPQSTTAPTSKEGILWGETFADYSYAAQAEDATQKGTNSFEIRRIYLGYEQAITDQFSARILLEGDSGDTTNAGTMTYYADQAYIQWKVLCPFRMFTLDSRRRLQLLFRKRSGDIDLSGKSSSSVMA